MSLTSRTLSRASTLASKRFAAPISARSYANYPFTFPNDSTVTPQASAAATSAPKSPYPFTNKPNTPEQGSPVAPQAQDANRGRAGDNEPEHMKQSDLMLNQEGEYHQMDMTGRQPDYDAAADYRTSTFAPVPMRVMDGSEPTDITPAAVLSGAPTELQARTVRIFRPSKTATQSGAWHGHQWRMDWDILQKGHRWENPLMGWQSSGDTMQGTNLVFKTKEDAILFANKQGYEYYVQEPNERRVIPKAYATQFIHSPKKLKAIRTK